VTQRTALPIQTELELKLGLKPRGAPATKETTSSAATAAHLGRVRKDIMAAVDELHTEQRHLLVTVYAELLEVRKELSDLRAKDAEKGPS
jgi:hypothetical protein